MVDAQIQKRVEELRSEKIERTGMQRWMKPGSVWEHLPEKEKKDGKGTPSRSEHLAAEFPLDFSGHDWTHVDQEKLLKAEEENKRYRNQFLALNERVQQLTSIKDENTAKIKMLEKQLEDRDKRIKILEGRRGR